MGIQFAFRTQETLGKRGMVMVLFLHGKTFSKDYKMIKD